MPAMLITKSPNNNATAKLMSVPEPTEDEFNLFRKLVQKELGFEWGDDKKYLLYSRVQRRLQKNKLQTFQNYYDLLKEKKTKVSDSIFTMLLQQQKASSTEKKNISIFFVKIFSLS